MSTYQPLRKPWAIGLANRFNLQTLPQHADQILVAAAVYQALFTVGSPVISGAVVPNFYDKLNERNRVNWDSRVVGLVQAAFICTQALNVILTDPTRTATTVQQRLWSYSPSTGSVQAYAAGYFLWDIYISARHIDLYGPTSLAHAVCAFMVTLVGFRPFGNYYGVNFVLYELSTPFLNIHWMLDKYGMTGSQLQLYNGIALMTTFFGCRLVWGSYQTWLLTQDMLSAWRSGPVPELLFSTYLLANTTLTGLNFYWFSKMVSAMRKRFSGKTNKHDRTT